MRYTLNEVTVSPNVGDVTQPVFKDRLSGLLAVDLESFSQVPCAENTTLAKKLKEKNRLQKKEAKRRNHVPHAECTISRVAVAGFNITTRSMLLSRCDQEQDVCISNCSISWHI